MSKRGPGAGFDNGEERYGSGGGNSGPVMNDDKPTLATQAQMARRKIAKASGSNRQKKSGSPMNPFAQQNQQSANTMLPQQQQSQSFSMTPNMNFGGGGGFQFGGNTGSASPAPFQFGASAPAAAMQSQTNGNTSMFGQNNTPSFGNSFNSGSTQPQQNGFTSTASTFNQPSQSTNNASFGGFGQSQQTQQTFPTPATTTSNTFGSFGSFGNSQSGTQNGTGGFGQPASNTQGGTQNSTGGFGQPASNSQGGMQNGIGSFGQTPSNNSQGGMQNNTGLFGQTNTNNQGGLQKTTGVFGQTPSNNQGGMQNGIGAFGQTASNNQDKTDNPFSRSSTPFGQLSAAQQQEQSNSTTNSGVFATANSKPSISSPGLGQNNPFANLGKKPEENGNRATTPSSSSGQNGTFTGFGQKQPETTSKASAQNSIFGANNNQSMFSQQNGEAAKSPAKEIAKNPFTGFGTPQVNGEKSSAEQTNASGQSQASTPQPEKPSSNSIFGGLSQAGQAEGKKVGLFGSTVLPNDPLAGTESIFSKLPKKDLSNGGKPLFNSSQVYRPEDDPDEDNNEENRSGNTFGQSQPQPPKRLGGLFQPVDSQKQSAGSLFQNHNASRTSDVSMDTSESSAKKDLFPAAHQAEEPAETTAETPAPRSLFDRITKEDQIKHGLSRPDDSQPSETPSRTNSGGAPVTPATAFKPSTSLLAPAGTHTPVVPPPQKSLFDRSGQAAPQSSGPFTPAPLTAAPISSNAPATAPAPRTAAPVAQPPAQRTSAQSSGAMATVSLTSAQQARIKDLNEGLVAFLNTEDTEKDWTGIFDYYAKTAAEIRNLPVPAPRAPPANETAPQPQTIDSGNASSRLFASSTTAAVAPPPPSTTSTPSGSSNMFSQGAKPSSSVGAFATQTPKAAIGNMFAKPPSTAPPAAKKRPFEEDDEEPAQPPASDKRVKPNDSASYPKLPENASTTAKLFQATLDKPTTSGFNPSTKSLFSNSASQTTSATAAPAFKPTSGGFTPSLAQPSAGTGSFLSAFGNKAKQQEEKDRKKRKAEDYDSDGSETEEQWEIRDRQEQEAKRQKLSEAAKGAQGFKLPGALTPNGDAATPSKPGTASTETYSTTPAHPPPKFNGLFGPSTPAMNEPGKLAPPTSGFGFGQTSASTDASRATTPGLTTDGEASAAAEADDNEPSDEPNMAQIDDHTALQPAEREASEILLEIEKTTIKKLTKNAHGATVWGNIGSGRVYVLKDKANGKTRILNRVGLGRTSVNFNPVKGAKYEIYPTRPKTVIATFIDHIHENPTKIGRFSITTQSAEDANKLAEILTAGVPQ